MQIVSRLLSAKPVARRTAGFITIAAWLAEAAFAAIHALTMGRVVASGVDLTENIQSDLQQWAVVVLFGIAGGCLIFLSEKYWRIFAVLAAMAYLVSWYFMGTTSSVPFLDAYALKLNTAKILGTYASFALRDVILPISFVAVLILTLFSPRR